MLPGPILTALLQTKAATVCPFAVAATAGEPHPPIAKTEISRWEAVLPAVLIIFSMEYFLLMLFRGDVALPLLLTVTVLPTHPAVEIHLGSTTHGD